MITPVVYVIATTNFVTPEGKMITKDIMQEVVSTEGDYYCVIFRKVALAKWILHGLDEGQVWPFETAEVIVGDEA